jgi:23S rRNA (adenine2503-C2)-methyltransferase
MRIEQIRQTLRRAGAKPCHEERILRAWTQGRALDQRAGRGRTIFSPVAAQLAAEHWPRSWRAGAVTSEHRGADGSSRLLVQLADGQTVESVLLPRDGLCVSSQVGCAVGCTFCMTGRSGLLRQLGSAEIVAQVVLARARRKVGKVVFMGMGEPAHNMDNVLDAMDLLGTAGGIGHKNLVFSTVGDRRVFERLPLATRQAGAGVVAAYDARRAARATAAQGAGHRAGRTGELGEDLFARHRLSDPVPMDAAARHQRRRRRARRHRAPAARASTR